MHNRLLELSDKIKKLKSMKDELAAEVKDNNQAIKDIEKEMSDLMIQENLTSFKRDGSTFTLSVEEKPQAVTERKNELYEAFKAESERLESEGQTGFEDLFSINAQTLGATVKELMGENDDELPPWLDGLIKFHQQTTIKVTNYKNYKN